MAKRPTVRAFERDADPSIPAAEVFSFLKEMSGEVDWVLRDMTKSLRIPMSEAQRIAAIFEIQGYIKPHEKGAWITTPSGEEVSRAKIPRFTQEHVEHALKSLAERIEAVNRDRGSEFKVTHAVAFGDFLRIRPRVQAADVGIALESRSHSSDSGAVKRSREQRRFLKALRGRIAALNLKPLEPWMSARSHRQLIQPDSESH